MSFAVTAVVIASAATTVHTVETQKEMGRQNNQRIESAKYEAEKKQKEIDAEEARRKEYEDMGKRNAALRERRRYAINNNRFMSGGGRVPGTPGSILGDSIASKSLLGL